MSKMWDSLRLFQLLAGLSALILTIGVLIEYGVQLKQLIKLFWKWLLRKATQFEKCVLRKMLLHLIGPILVIIGVAGDVLFEIRLFVIEDEQEIALEQARKAATDSQLQLDQYLAQHIFIIPTDFSRFELLRKFAPGHATIFYKDNDGEAYENSEEIAQALKGVSWTVEVKELPHNPGDPPVIGRELHTPDLDRPRPEEIFSTAPSGRTVTLWKLIGGDVHFDKTLPRDTFQIVIGQHVRRVP
jgi:hypothetical protein